MSETKITLLGTVTIDDGERLVIPNINAPVDEIRAALEAAERARVEAQAEESRRLKAMFLPKAEDDDVLPPRKPPARDWLFP